MRGLLLATFVLALAACGSDGSSGSSGAAAGGACVSGKGCAAGLYCFVTGPEPTGVCAVAPAACGGKLTCSGACYDALKSTCPSDAGPSTSAHCSGISGSYTVGCYPAPPRRAEGQSCSTIVGCVTGTYCNILDTTQVGTCAKLPAACATAPTCECLKTVSGACSSGHICSVLGDSAEVACL